MTVDQLLAKLSAAYGLFNANALEAWAQVFRARLGDHEGPVLAKAFTDTLASFKPMGTKAFPIPLDFELNLPARGLKLAEEGPSLRDPLARRQKAMGALMDEWWASQGARIQEARGELVAISCKHMAADLAKRFGWRDDPPKVRLTTDQIEIAVSRTISRQRVIMFGPIPKKAEVWRDQMEMAKGALTPKLAVAAE